MSVDLQDPLVLAAAKEWLEGNAKLFASQEFSDLVIRCGDQEFRVHKSILCARSEYFSKACSQNFKEGHESLIELHEDDPDIVKMMLQSLYTLKFDPINAESLGLVTSVKVFAIAEKYMLDSLLAIVGQKFYEIASEQYSSAEFARAIAEAYQTTQDTESPLRRAIQRVCFENSWFLLADPLCNQEFRQMARETPGFATDFAVCLAQCNVPAGEFEDMLLWKCSTTGCRVMKVTDEEPETAYRQQCWECGYKSRFLRATDDEWQRYWSDKR